MSLLPLVLVWLQLLLSQEQWRFLHEDGAVTAAWGAKPEVSAGASGSVVSAWSWSGRRAPRHVAPARVGRDTFPNDRQTLTVQIVRRAGGRPPDDLRVYAAPRAMWEEIPERDLPSWPVPKGGRLAIPVDPGSSWRLRVAGRGEGSWWVDVPAGRRSAFLATAPAAGIDLSVVDTAGRSVGSIDGFLAEAAGRGTTVRTWARVRSETGGLAAPGLPDEADVALHFLKPGWAPALLRGRPSLLPRRFELDPGAELSGRLVDRGGSPVAGAMIEAEFFSPGKLPQLLKSGSRSGPHGEWLLPGLPAGKVAWSARAPGLVPLAETFEVRAGAHMDIGVRAFEAGMVLRLQVLDDAEAPIAGAQVQGSSGLPGTTTDADGMAVLSGLPAAPIEIKGSAPRHLAGALRLSPPFPASPRLLLLRAFTLAGRFLDPGGSPVLRGSVRVDSRSCRREEGLRTGGQFELDLPPDGPEAQLLLRSPETQELRVAVSPGRAGELRDLGDLRAPAGLTVTGRAIRGDDGRPVPGAHVWTTRQGPDGPAVAWAARDLLETVTGEDGRFRLSGLAPAPATLRIEAAGLARAQLPLALAEGEGPLDLGTLELAEGATLHVRVGGRDREVAGAVARADLGNLWLEPDLLTAEVWNGEAVLSGVPPGKVTVSVLAGRRLLCEQVVQVPASGELDVDCSRPALTVSGRVLIGDVPVPSGTLLWQPPGLDVPSRIDTMVSPGGLRFSQITGAGRPSVNVPVGASGGFTTDDLIPGHWQVLWTEEGSMTASLAVEIPEVERFTTELRFAGHGVTGTVVDRAGRPVERARVRELKSGALALSGANGGFSLTGLRPGKALVRAQLQDETSALAEVTLEEAGAPPPLRLVLGDRTAPSIAIQVADATGTPVPGAFVFFEEEGKGVRLVASAVDGRVTVALEPPWTERVRAAAFAGGAWGFGAWVSREGAAGGLLVPLGGSGSLVVASPRLEGSPRIATPSGWDLSWLLRLLGAPPALSAAQPLELSGLPAGLYQISLEKATATVAVADGKIGRGQLP